MKRLIFIALFLVSFINAFSQARTKYIWFSPLVWNSVTPSGNGWLAYDSTTSRFKYRAINHTATIITTDDSALYQHAANVYISLECGQLMGQ